MLEVPTLAEILKPVTMKQEQISIVVRICEEEIIPANSLTSQIPVSRNSEGLRDLSVRMLVNGTLEGESIFTRI